jgi:hypothetical protein
MPDNPASQIILPGTVQAAQPGLKGFDTVATISSALATQFKNSGYSFCARYLSLGNGQNPGDLTNAEATTILNAGLALIPVQHVNAYGWIPTATLGTTHGTHAASNAKSIGLPAGINIWCDLEGVAAGTSAQDVIAYCQAWYAGVFAAGYIPGLYVGPQCVLTGAQLYSNLSFQHYWKSASNVPVVANRGYQLIQGLSPNVNGTGIDSDLTQNDNKGGTVIWLKI